LGFWHPQSEAAFLLERSVLSVKSWAFSSSSVPAILPRPLSSARFYAILDTGYAPAAKLGELARAVLTGGADIVQLRAKKSTTAERIALLQEIAPLCASAGVPLVCNDDLTAALAVPSVGLHLGQDDLPAREARAALGPERVLGLSTHSLAQAQGALALGDILNYFAVGPVYKTGTKPDYPPVGLELVRTVAALNPSLPWFCIGGLNLQNAPLVRVAGAKALVAVSEVLRAENPAAVVRSLRKEME
jgi:thiamine-phosphate pyrophosphorylase